MTRCTIREDGAVSSELAPLNENHSSSRSSQRVIFLVTLTESTASAESQVIHHRVDQPRAALPSGVTREVRWDQGISPLAARGAVASPAAS